jgi:hypothetical protein
MTRYFAIVTSNDIFIAESGAVMPTGGSETSPGRVTVLNGAPRPAGVAAEPIGWPGATADNYNVSARPTGHGLRHERDRTLVRNRITSRHKGDVR